MRPTCIFNPLLPLLLLAAFARTAAAADTVSTIIETATASSNAAAATNTQYTSDSDFEKAMLDGQNFYRSEHNASALTWNTTSATYAAHWSKQCAFKHSVRRLCPSSLYSMPSQTFPLFVSHHHTADTTVPGWSYRREPRRRLRQCHSRSRCLGRRAQRIQLQSRPVRRVDGALYTDSLEVNDFGRLRPL